MAFNTIATVAAGTTAYHDSGLAGSTKYYYRVQGYGAAGSSAFSNVASATTLASAPVAPTNLTAIVSRGRAKLSWRDQATNESGFYVYSSRDGMNWTRMASVSAKRGSGGNVSYTSGALASGTWYFRVTAFNAAGESVPSNFASVLIR